MSKRIYNLIPQKRENYCVCACFQAMMRRREIKLTQEQIAAELTPTETGFSMSDQRAINLFQARELELKTYTYKTTPFHEPDLLIANSRDAVIGIRDHALLVIDFNDPLILFLDPKDAREANYNIHSLIKEMDETKKGEFAVLN